MSTPTITEAIMKLAGKVNNPARYRAYLRRLNAAKLEQRLSDLSADALRHRDKLDYGRGQRLVIKHPRPFSSEP